tara:strand:- start:652 stop:951 length:300 start_codon:yes stop_codon:yes gene_type:complete
MVSEALLQKYLVQQAKSQNVYAVKLVSQSRRGFPDVMLAYKGRVLFVEVKSPTGLGKLSALQALEITRLEAAGLTVRVIASREEADGAIRELTHSKKEK